MAEVLCGLQVLALHSGQLALVNSAAREVPRFSGSPQEDENSLTKCFEEWGPQRSVDVTQAASLANNDPLEILDVTQRSTIPDYHKQDLITSRRLSMGYANESMMQAPAVGFAGIDSSG